MRQESHGISEVVKVIQAQSYQILPYVNILLLIMLITQGVHIELSNYMTTALDGVHVLGPHLPFQAAAVDHRHHI